MDASEGWVLDAMGKLYCDELPYGSAAFLPTHGNCDQGALKDKKTVKYIIQIEPIVLKIPGIEPKFCSIFIKIDR